MDKETLVYVDLQGTPHLVGRLWARTRKDRAKCVSLNRTVLCPASGELLTPFPPFPDPFSPPPRPPSPQADGFRLWDTRC
jgi:hypothetical protein